MNKNKTFYLELNYYDTHFLLMLLNVSKPYADKDNNNYKNSRIKIDKELNHFEIQFNSIIKKDDMIRKDKPKTLKTGEYAYDKLLDQYGYK